MSALEDFIDNNDLTADEVDFLSTQCSGADEYHDIQRALDRCRSQGER